MLNTSGMLPLRTSMNVLPVLRALELNMSPPEKEDLAKFVEHIEQIIELREFMEQNVDSISLYLDLISEMKLPDELEEALLKAFDDEGNLSGEKYPTLANLRRQADQLRGKIVQTLKTLLQSQDMRDKITDRYHLLSEILFPKLPTSYL